MARTDVTWRDGSPVKVGQTAMSTAGPMRIDGIEVGAGGSWRLWADVSWMGDGARWLFVIDEGRNGSEHPTREGEPDEFFRHAWDTMPNWVFAPLPLNWDDWSKNGNHEI